MIEAKAFRTFIIIFSLFKSERLSTNIELTIHKALIRLVMTYACPTWELAASTCLLKLQLLEDKVLFTIGNFPRCNLVCDLHMAFDLLHVYDYVTKLCSAGKKQKLYKIMRRIMFAAQDKANPDIENIRGLNFVVVKLTPFKLLSCHCNIR
jgi:hypothetical protein